MDPDSNRSRQSASAPAASIPNRPDAHNFRSLKEIVREIAARSTAAEVAGKVAPLFAGEFLSCGVLRISNGSPRFHRQPNHEELLVVLEGEADFRVGSEVRRIGAGDFIAVPRNAVHGCEAIHGDALSFLSIISPQIDLARDVVWEDGGDPERYQLI